MTSTITNNFSTQVIFENRNLTIPIAARGLPFVVDSFSAQYGGYVSLTAMTNADKISIGVNYTLPSRNGSYSYTLGYSNPNNASVNIGGTFSIPSGNIQLIIYNEAIPSQNISIFQLSATYYYMKSYG